MLAPKRIAVVSMVVLTAATAGAVSYALSQRTALRAADKPAVDLERAKKEWQELERRHAEEMVKARLEVAEQGDQVRMLEQEWSIVRADLNHAHKLIESALAKLAQPKVPPQLQREENEISVKEQKLRADLKQARQKLFLADERMWQLAREQARQRERSRPRVDAVGEKRNGEQETRFQRRLQETEHELDRLRRQLAEVRHPSPPPQPSPLMLPARNSPLRFPAR